MSITTSSGNRITAQDLTSIANFYRQWFGVDYTAPASGARITAADFNNLRQAIINGAGSNWSLNTFPGAVNANDRIWASNWGDPVQNAQTINITISANTTNLDIHQALINAGWNTALVVHGVITINSGVAVGSTSTGAYALTISGNYVSGSTIQIVNNGYIIGRGGDGGIIPGRNAGSAGGPALYVGNLNNLSGLYIANNGIIGGGGGGGGSASLGDGTTGGGGGGAGYYGGSALGNGVSGTFTNGGAGGLPLPNNFPAAAGGSAGQVGSAGNHGALAGGGGGLGAAGGNGGVYSTPRYSTAGQAGGPAGAAVVGNGYINWQPSGAIYGSVS